MEIVLVAMVIYEETEETAREVRRGRRRLREWEKVGNFGVIFSWVGLFLEQESDGIRLWYSEEKGMRSESVCYTHGFTSAGATPNRRGKSGVSGKIRVGFRRRWRDVREEILQRMCGTMVIFFCGGNFFFRLSWQPGGLYFFILKINSPD